MGSTSGTKEKEEPERRMGLDRYVGWVSWMEVSDPVRWKETGRNDVRNSCRRLTDARDVVRDASHRSTVFVFLSLREGVILVLPTADGSRPFPPFKHGSLLPLLPSSGQGKLHPSSIGWVPIVRRMSSRVNPGPGTTRTWTDGRGKRTPVVDHSIPADVWNVLESSRKQSNQNRCDSCTSIHAQVIDDAQHFLDVREDGSPLSWETDRRSEPSEWKGCVSLCLERLKNHGSECLLHGLLLNSFAMDA